MEINKNIVVSVCMITYNHENYIAQAIEGVLMQQTNFDIELVIGEDCSTDKTRDICMEYASKYHTIIRLLRRKENLGISKNFFNTLNKCTGKYIAICEGDDYWTDPLKLQKQVDFMEMNPEYSVCFHRYDIYDETNKQFRSDACGIYLNECDKNKEVTIDMFLRHWVTQPLTMMYRNGVNLGGDKKYTFYRDQHIIFHLLQAGKGALLNFKAGVYREHTGGIHSKTTVESQCKIGLIIAEELYEKNGKSAILKSNYLRYLDWGITIFSKSNKKYTLQLILKRFIVSKSIKNLLKQLYKFLSK